MCLEPPGVGLEGQGQEANRWHPGDLWVQQQCRRLAWSRVSSRLVVEAMTDRVSNRLVGSTRLAVSASWGEG